MTRILVTGGAGYIGSHCCAALAAAGFEPVVYDDLSTGHAEFVRWGPRVEGDIRDEPALRAAMRTHRPEAVMHFAALALVGESMTDPDRYRDVNVGGTQALLRAMRAEGLDHLVFSSTCAVYGEPDVVPISESEALDPVNPYGATKLACERMMDDFDAAHGLRSVRLRYFNAAGADPEARIGEWHDPETHLLPLVIEAALGRRAAIDIFGTDYATPDGTAVRDYVHVVDLAAAHLAALRYLLEGGATAAVNLGTGDGASVEDVVRAVEVIAGRPVARRLCPRRPGDPPRLVAAPGMARDLLGWRPERSDLATIVADALRWHRTGTGQGR